MGTSWVTVCALAGASCPAVRAVFREAKRDGKPDLLSRLFEELRTHATTPHVAFFREYVDAWTVAFSTLSQVASAYGRSASKLETGRAGCFLNGRREEWYGDDTFFLISRPTKNLLADALRARLRNRRLYSVDQWLLQSLYDATESVSWLKTDDLILIRWRIVGAFQRDEEKIVAARTVAPWLKELRTSRDLP